MKKINKRGLSPVITTVLLIAIVIVLVVIIFLWLTQWIPDAIVKDGRDIEQVCQEVSFQAGYDSVSGDVLLSNTGNQPIYAFNIEQVIGGGSSTRVNETQARDSSTPDLKEIGAGGSGRIPGSDFGMDASTSELIIKPVLLGRSGEVEKKYLCGNHPGIRVDIPAP